MIRKVVMSLKKGDLIQHSGTQGTYKVVGLGHTKVYGKWKTSITYRCCKSGLLYTRSVNDLHKFSSTCSLTSILPIGVYLGAACVGLVTLVALTCAYSM